MWIEQIQIARKNLLFEGIINDVNNYRTNFIMNLIQEFNRYLVEPSFLNPRMI